VNYSGREEEPQR
jgi:hypothetical protein